MTAFSDRVARSHAAVFGGMGDPDAVLTPADGSTAVAAAAMLLRPTDRDLLAGGSGPVRMRPEVHAPVSLFPVVRKGDVWTIADGEGRGRWRVADTPERSTKGSIWICAVQDLGPVT